MAENMKSDNPTEQVKSVAMADNLHYPTKQDTAASSILLLDSGDNFDMHPLGPMKLEKYLKEKEQRIRKIFFNKFFGILTNEPSGLDKETATTLANAFLDSEDPQVSSNADVEDPLLEQLRMEWLGTDHESMILLRFPVTIKNPSLNADDDFRKRQNEEFVRLCETVARVSHKRIDSRDELFESLDQFLHGCTTKLATVVFNGHGVSDGLSVHQGGPVPLDNIIAKVQGHSRRTVSDAIDILFGQCYGHVHNYRESPWDIVYIKSLTTSSSRETFNFDSRHIQLETEATRRQEVTELEERRRQQERELEERRIEQERAFEERRRQQQREFEERQTQQEKEFEERRRQLLNLQESEGQYQQVEQTGQSMSINEGLTSGYISMRQSGQHSDFSSVQASKSSLLPEDTTIQALTEHTGNLQLAASQENTPALTADRAVSSLGQPPVVDGSEASNSQLPALQSLLQPDEDLDDV